MIDWPILSPSNRPSSLPQPWDSLSHLTVTAEAVINVSWNIYVGVLVDQGTEQGQQSVRPTKCKMLSPNDLLLSLDFHAFIQSTGDYPKSITNTGDNGASFLHISVFKIMRSTMWHFL